MMNVSHFDCSFGQSKALGMFLLYDPTSDDAHSKVLVKRLANLWLTNVQANL